MSRVRAEQFLQKAVKEGKFGEAEIIECIFDDGQKQNQFASILVFVTVKLKHKNVIRCKEVVVKMQQENEFIRETMNTDAQFYNEKLMYQDILPFLNQNNTVQEVFPQCYYSNATYGENPLEDFIILEDLRSCGFRLSSERLFLDYDRCVLSVKQLGRYHALSYAAKQRNFTQFMEKVNQLKEANYEKEQRDDFNKFLMPNLERGILILFEKGQHKEVLENLASSIDDPFVFIKSLIVPEEPIAVLCHGDFCRNNILYKYEDNKLTDAKIYDLAISRYCSPAIDLSFLIFLNIPSQIRREHWDDILTAYHDGLSSAVPGTKVPSLDVIKVEMRRKAVYAYVLCSFFIPVMMGYERIELEDFAMLTQDEIEGMYKNYGGQEATDAVVAVLEDLILEKCL